MFVNQLSDPQPVNGSILGLRSQTRALGLLTSRMYGKLSACPTKGSCLKNVKITGKKSLYINAGQ